MLSRRLSSLRAAAKKPDQIGMGWSSRQWRRWIRWRNPRRPHRIIRGIANCLDRYPGLEQSAAPEGCAVLQHDDPVARAGIPRAFRSFDSASFHQRGDRASGDNLRSLVWRVPLSATRRSRLSARCDGVAAYFRHRPDLDGTVVVAHSRDDGSAKYADNPPINTYYHRAGSATGAVVGGCQ